MIKQLLIAGLGGAIGTMARYGIYCIIRPQSFPYATLMINIAGSLLIGMIMAFSLRHSQWPDSRVVFLATGICGGFTTFSAFSYENLLLIQNGRITAAV